MWSAFHKIGAFFASVKGWVYMASLTPAVATYVLGIWEQLPWALKITATMATLAFGLIIVALGVMVWGRIDSIIYKQREKAELRKQRKLWRDAKLHELWESAANLINKTKDFMHGYSASDEDNRRALTDEWRKGRQNAMNGAEIFLSDERIFLSAQNFINRCDIVVNETRRHGEPFVCFREATEAAKHLWREIEK